MKKMIFIAGLIVLGIIVAMRIELHSAQRDADEVELYIEAAENITPAACEPPDTEETLQQPDPVPALVADPVPAPVVTPEPAPQHYTDADAVALAQMVWGEGRGINSLSINGKEITGTCQKAAIMWCALNRLDAGYEEDLLEVIAAPHQFIGYAASNPVDDELLALAYDVLERWNMEQNGGTDVGRVLPADCHWFVGDGKHNYFRNAYSGGRVYSWDLPDVYGGAK